MSARMLRPEPYIQSMVNLKPACAILSSSANLQIAATYGVLKSASSIFAALPLGMAPARTLSSICLIIAGVAEPPYGALNLTPFQSHGLWLDVIMIPPAVPRFLTA